MRRWVGIIQLVSKQDYKILNGFDSKRHVNLRIYIAYFPHYLAKTFMD